MLLPRPSERPAPTASSVLPTVAGCSEKLELARATNAAFLRPLLPAPATATGFPDLASQTLWPPIFLRRHCVPTRPAGCRQRCAYRRRRLSAVSPPAHETAPLASATSIRTLL